MEIIHYHFESLPSTNDWAKKHLETFDPDSMTLVTADVQTAGRGQYGRKWSSPKELNLYASFCFFIDENQQDPLSLTHVFAISVADLLKKHQVECQIKWPNDVMVKRKKIAGILCETEKFSSRFGVIIGVGLNVNMPKELLDEIDQPATSLLVETQKTWDKQQVLEALKEKFSTNLEIYLAKGFTPFLPTFRSLILPEVNKS